MYIHIWEMYVCMYVYIFIQLCLFTAGKNSDQPFSPYKCTTLYDTRNDMATAVTVLQIWGPNICMYVTLHMPSSCTVFSDPEGSTYATC